jgi:LacI family transcriptional regulator
MVSDELRQNVFRSAAQLGYVANMAARALVRGRSGLIGAVVGDLGTPGAACALGALDEEIRRAGYALILAGCVTGPVSLALVRALIQRGVEAVVFLGVAAPPDILELPGFTGLPSVSIHGADVASADGTGPEAGRAQRLVIDYLVQLGHRRVALVADAAMADESVAIASRHDPSSDLMLRRLSVGDRPTVDILLGTLEAPDPPTALVCGSDAIALGLLQACATLGVQVPGRLSLVGSGDTRLARCASPALTSVRIPSDRAGQAAASYLLARLAGRSVLPGELPVKLVVRASTGPPPR